jgi:integrase
MRHISDEKSAVIVPLTRGQIFTLKELADTYMACYQGGDRQQATRLAYFVSHLGTKAAHEIDGDDIQDVLDALQRRGRVHNRGGASRDAITLVETHKPLKPASVNRYRTTIQALLTWGRKRRLMPKGWMNPVTDTERLPEDNVRTRYLNEAEYLRLLKASKASYWKKLHVLIKLAVTTGARRGTLMGLRWADVDIEGLRAFAERTKNGEPFVLVLQDDVAKELKSLRGASAADELIFCGRNPFKPMNFEKAYHNAMANAGIEGACFHTLRHTHASWLAKQGAPLLAIADSLGHKSLEMTKRYAHLCVDSRAAMLSRVFAAAA